MKLADLWLIDRSRLEAEDHCQIKRYYQYHAGPHGYGYTGSGSSMPLSTGLAVHAALEPIMKAVSEGSDVTPELQQLSVSVACERMARSITVTDGVSFEEGQRAVKEQQALVAGLVFGWVKTALPTLLHTFDVIHVEQEEAINVTDQIIQMSRPDFVCRNKITGELSIHDFKTTAFAGDSFINEWIDSVQMMVGSLGVWKRLGEEVKSYYIHGLVKGMRKASYNETARDYSGPVQQQSPLCYGYYRPGTPPFVNEDWQPNFQYKDSQGNVKRLSRGYEKRPVWETFTAWDWVNRLPQATLNDLFVQAGPYPISQFKLAQFLRGLKTRETDFIAKLAAANAAEAKYGWKSEAFQEALDSIFTRTYDCYPYGRRCGSYALCFRQQGWEDPIESGLYVHRRPHHALEVDQMKELGIPVPPERWDEE